MINISKLLKNAPKGMKLYSPLFGEVKFKYINNSQFGIVVEDSADCSRSFDKYGRYFTIYDNAECLLFPNKDCRTWKGWKAPVEPIFKVHDWIAGNVGTYKITQYGDELGYDLTDITGGVVHFVSPDYMESNFHLWTITDAKDGDVLVSSSGNPFIYNGNNEFAIAGAYVGISRDGKIAIDIFPSKCWTSIKGIKPATKEQRDLLLQKIKEIGYEWDCEKKELRKIIKPEFKVGNWIIRNDGCSDVPIQVYGLKKDRYLVTNMLGSKGEVMLTCQDEWHLWTIQDAKDGDILAGSDWLFILKQFNVKGNMHKAYCHYDLTLNRFKDDTDSYMASGSDEFYPATEQQRDLLFFKMKEAGYQWDAEKKELRKIKPHYDVSNFYAGMPVLERSGNDEHWDYNVFSRYLDNNCSHPFILVGCHSRQCIPFEGNEHLLGTTEPCSEEFINW